MLPFIVRQKYLPYGDLTSVTLVLLGMLSFMSSMGYLSSVTKIMLSSRLTVLLYPLRGLLLKGNIERQCNNDDCRTFQRLQWTCSRMASQRETPYADLETVNLIMLSRRGH